MSTLSLRSELPSTFKKLVVKIGSAALAHPDSGVNQRKINEIVADCQRLIQQGLQILIVTSGAIQKGKEFYKRLSSWKPSIELRGISLWKIGPAFGFYYHACEYDIYPCRYRRRPIGGTTLVL